jgi:hypothetical protein
MILNNTTNVKIIPIKCLRDTESPEFYDLKNQSATHQAIHIFTKIDTAFADLYLPVYTYFCLPSPVMSTRISWKGFSPEKLPEPYRKIVARWARWEKEIVSLSTLGEPRRRFRLMNIDQIHSFCRCPHRVCGFCLH